MAGNVYGNPLNVTAIGVSVVVTLAVTSIGILYGPFLKGFGSKQTIGDNTSALEQW